MDIVTILRTNNHRVYHPDFYKQHLVTRICLKLDNASIQTQKQWKMHSELIYYEKLLAKIIISFGII